MLSTSSTSGLFAVLLRSLHIVNSTQILQLEFKIAERHCMQTADFFGDADTVKLAADALAARLLDVPAGQIAHGMGPKGPTLAGSAEHHYSEHTVSEAPAEVGSREQVAENKKVTRYV